MGIFPNKNLGAAPLILLAQNILAEDPKSLLVPGITFAPSAHLRDEGAGSIPEAMKKIIDMDDRSRLPWRFFGASLSVLAHL
ncbi:hypothetical protein ACEWPL_007660 [Roseovarius sp. S1116L3]|uniref:hypothetical protein n=1 Tax=Roseovarius roseus TaxID=3342636 RepID=UPI00372C89ED